MQHLAVFSGDSSRSRHPHQQVGEQPLSPQSSLERRRRGPGGGGSGWPSKRRCGLRLDRSAKQQVGGGVRCILLSCRWTGKGVLSFMLIINYSQKSSFQETGLALKAVGPNAKHFCRGPHPYGLPTHQVRHLTVGSLLWGGLQPVGPRWAGGRPTQQKNSSHNTLLRMPQHGRFPARVSATEPGGCGCAWLTAPVQGPIWPN